MVNEKGGDRKTTLSKKGSIKKVAPGSGMSLETTDYADRKG
jgi:hypothetical protein